MTKVFSKMTTVVAVAAAIGLTATGVATADTSGTASWYNDAGIGACGTSIDASSEFLVAAPAALWTTSNPNDDPLCSRSIQVTFNGNTITVPIKDKCPTCDASKIDLSLPAFQSLADPNVGIIDVTWSVV